MFTRPKSFSILYGIQRRLLNLFYLISVVAVFWVLFYILHDVLNLGGSVIIPVSIVYFILIGLIYSIIQVIAYIPSNLAGAFDPVKNSIADRSISTSGQLAGALAEFMCSFFNFVFFDIEGAIVKIMDRAPVSSDSIQTDGIELDLHQLDEKALNLYETTYIDKVSTPSGKLHLYLIPMIFGDLRLGYMAIATRQKLWKIFTLLLNEFENDYVDDQVVHILELEKK
jgi:hypothetical protein